MSQGEVHPERLPLWDKNSRRHELAVERTQASAVPGWGLVRRAGDSGAQGDCGLMWTFSLYYDGGFSGIHLCQKLQSHAFNRGGFLHVSYAQ